MAVEAISSVSIISIIIGVIIVAYFVIKACVLKCFYHAEGLEVIPHYKLWCTIGSQLKVREFFRVS